MTSSGDFSLYSYDCFCDGDQWHYQYVFHAESVHPWSSPSLSRVNSVPDLLELLSGDKEATTKFVVGIIALLAGNLIAKGQLAELLSFIVFFLAVGVLQWPLAAKSAAGLLVCYFLSSLHDGVSLEWAVTVFVVMFLAVLAVMLIRMLSKQDPRSYVLLKDSADSRPCSSSSSSSSSIRNACHMDVKVLCFHRDDRVQFIPKGGLLPSNSVVRRNQEIQLKDGDQGPLTVKIFAPFETELGTWSNVQGAYVLRATAPPVTIKPGRPCFRNLSEHNVVVCCSAYDWRCSLWLPLSQLVARLLTPGIVVKSNAEISLTQHLQHLQHVQHEHVAWDPDGRGHGFDQFTAEKDQKDLTGETGESFQSETAPGIPSIPSIPSTKPGDVCRDSDFSRKLVLRVYGGLVGSLGLWGGVLEKACCMVELNEQIDYDGGISWSTPWRNRGPFNSIISSWKSRESNWREQKGF